MGHGIRAVSHGYNLDYERMHANNICSSDVSCYVKLSDMVADDGVDRAGLKQRKYIMWLTVYTYVGWGIVEICYFTMCRPFNDYFAVPNPPGKGMFRLTSILLLEPSLINNSLIEQCASYFNVLIIQGCFNVTSDIGMLLVGIPLLVMVKVPVQKKIGVIIVFGMGIFVIIAAILNKVYSTSPALLNDSVNYTFWYMRESTVGVYVINLPALWPVLRAIFPLLTGRGSSSDSRGNTSKTGSRPWLSSRKRTQIESAVKDDVFEMKSRAGADADLDSMEGGRSGFNTSQEHIIENGSAKGKGGLYPSTGVLEINHDVSFTVEHSTDENFPLPMQSNATNQTTTTVRAEKKRGGKDYGI